MSYPVRYSTRACIEYEELLAYVADEFGVTVMKKVDNHFEKVIDQISLNPFLYPYSDKKKKLRRCVISPQTKLYYRFTGEHVELASFRGNRMDPKTLGL